VSMFEDIAFAKAALSLVNDEMDAVLARRGVLRKQIAELNSPFAPGDRVISKQGVEYHISRVEWYIRDTSYQLYGHRLKVDGGLYVVEQRLYVNNDKLERVSD